MFGISCRQRKMRQELINETIRHSDSFIICPTFMGLNGIKNFEPRDGNKQRKVVYSLLPPQRPTGSWLRISF